MSKAGAMGSQLGSPWVISWKIKGKERNEMGTFE